MAKWIFAVLVLFGTGVEAHEPQKDGCAVLERIIYEEVTATSWGMISADTSLRRIDAPGVVVCVGTTPVASKAFKAAMQTVGQEVAWNLPINPGMEACLGGDIEQCITTPSPWLPVTGLDDAWQVSSAWNAVSSAVRQAMPYGSASDRSVFDVDSLRHAVRSAILSRRADSWSGRSRRTGRTD